MIESYLIVKFTHILTYIFFPFFVIHTFVIFTNYLRSRNLVSPFYTRYVVQENPLEKNSCMSNRRRKNNGWIIVKNALFHVHLLWYVLNKTCLKYFAMNWRIKVFFKLKKISLMFTVLFIKVTVASSVVIHCKSSLI